MTSDVAVAARLAAFYGLRPEEAERYVAAARAGETAALRPLGVYLVRRRGDDAVEALSEQLAALGG